MSTGLTIKQIKTVIPTTLREVDELVAVFGFGSFFRGETFDDVDLAIVFSNESVDLVAAYYEVRHLLRTLERNYKVKFDVTPLTVAEFSEKPLISHGSLDLVYKKQNHHSHGLLRLGSDANSLDTRP